MDVLIIDDHPLFRAGIATLVAGIAEGARLIELTSCEEALEWLSANPSPAVVLLDLKLPGMDGMTGLSVLRDASPATPLVVLSATEDAGQVRRALAAGAMGYIPKSSDSAVIAHAIRLVLAGGVYLPVNVMDDAVEAGGEALPAADEIVLTRRQREVLELLAHGQSNKEIASALDLAENTVRVHVAAILRSLDARNRTEAGYRAVSLGLIDC
jgi:DNA-binding NarL/FixJ family response regulator